MYVCVYKNLVSIHIKCMKNNRYYELDVTEIGNLKEKCVRQNL